VIVRTLTGAVAIAAAPSEAPLPTEKSSPSSRSGITLTFPGATWGEDILIEPWCSKPDLVGGATYHVKTTTPMLPVHNAQNIVGSRETWAGINVAVLIGEGGDEKGVIRRRIDEEWGVRAQWLPGGHAAWGAAAKSLSELTLSNGDPVVGTTGPVPGVAATTANVEAGLYYHRGVIGPFGEEGHNIAFADDDTDIVAGYGLGTTHDAEGDGRNCSLVIGGRIPVPIFTALDDERGTFFLTDPDRVTNTPRRHLQRTRVTGNVQVEIASLDRELCDVSFVPVGFDRVWVPVTGPINLQEACEPDLNANTPDEGYELAFRIRGSDVVAVRRIHYREAVYDSDAEDPIDLLTSDADALFKARIADPNLPPTTAERFLYKAIYEAQRAAADPTGPYAIALGDGRRTRNQGGLQSAAVGDVFVVEGFSAYPTKRDWFRADSCDNMLAMLTSGCLVGWEISGDGNSPSYEWMHPGGYSTSNTPLDLAIAYARNKHTFRAGLVTGGWTIGDEWIIRESLAAFCHASMLNQSNSYAGFINTVNTSDKGMWSAARAMIRRVIAEAMPEYDTPHYGTSGSSRGSQPPARLWAPWRDYAYTWVEACDSTTIAVGESPNINRRSGIHGWIYLDGGGNPRLADRCGYLQGEGLMGHIVSLFMNIMANLGVRYTHLEAAIELAALSGLPCDIVVGDDAPVARCFDPNFVNTNFPAIASKLVALQAGDTYPAVTLASLTGAAPQNADPFVPLQYTPYGTRLFDDTLMPT